MFALPDFDLRALERPRVVHIAEAVISAPPHAITSEANPRSAGGPHDFSSEGDYWWPDSKNPGGPYVRRDGETNPANFTAHRRLLMKFARSVGALAAAYDLTGEERYADAAVRQLRAWLVDPATRMTPSLQFAQSIKGVATGRGIGLIDTVHFVEVALGVEALRGSRALTPADDAAITDWFRDYLKWIRTHPYGIAEAKEKNNHGTCWALQAAAFARLTHDDATLTDCRRRFTEVLLPEQMAANGSLPLEMARTKSYGYSIFGLDTLCALAVVLSTPQDDLMNWKLPDGRGLIRGVEFLAPYLADKSKWPKPPDVMYWDAWPIRQPSLLFGALTAGNRDWLATWQKLPPDSEIEEVQRNCPLRFPTLWLRRPGAARKNSPLPAVAAPGTKPPLQEIIARALATSAKQYAWMLAHMPDDGKLPRSYEHGKLVTVASRDWTAGFFPGSLWDLFEATGDAKWRAAATRYTALLESEQNNTRTHDVGFILNCSYGNGYRLTGDDAYRAVLLKGAGSLSTRFNPTVGSIRSWDADHKSFTFPVIIDNMMNLELLLVAARSGGESRWRDIAMLHADTALRNHFRPDASSFHVVDYDPADGHVLRRITHQGAADNSAWARGQAWGLYGFTTMYRETHETRYLAQAEKIATFIMNHPRLPADKVPYWDFDAPGQPDAPRDSSAAAVMCSALFELARLTGDAAAAARYTAFAQDQLRALASPAYLAQPGENGGFLLKHATGNFPKSGEVDAPLSYGDYYFIEALLRAKAVR